MKGDEYGTLRAAYPESIGAHARRRHRRPAPMLACLPAAAARGKERSSATERVMESSRWQGRLRDRRITGGQRQGHETWLVGTVKLVILSGPRSEQSRIDLSAAGIYY